MYFKRLIYRIRHSDTYYKLLNNYFLLAISVFLFLLTYNYKIFIIILISYLYYLYKKEKVLLKISIMLIFIIVLFLFISRINKNYFDKEEMVVNGKVIEVDKNSYNQRLLINTKKGKIIVYDNNFNNIDLGDKLRIKIKLKEVETNHNDNEFNYKDYLDKNNIKNVFELVEIESKKKSFSFTIIRKKIIEYFDKTYEDNTLIFLKALLLGYKEEMKEEMHNTFSINGVLHLFAISGLHISTLMLIFSKVLEYFKVNKKNEFYISLIFLLIYIIITDFTPSILRASIMYLLLCYSKLKNLRLTSLDAISIAFIVLLLINPYFMYSLGFTLSFVVSFVIILLSPLIKKQSKIKQGLLISISSIIFTFPITINLNNQINLMSPLINIIDIFFVTTIIFPFSLVLLLFPFLNIIYEFIIKLFMTMNNFWANSISINLSFPNFTFLKYIMFYSFLILIFICYKNKKLRNIFSISLFTLIIIIYFNIKPLIFNEVYFLDIYNGESIVLVLNNKVTVIDTGDGKDETVTNFLIKKGYRKIDYLILTHNHLDHNGEVDIIINKLNVKSIITSVYDDSIYSTFNNTIKVSANDTFNIEGYSFEVLHPDKLYKDPNDNSIVLKVKLGPLKFLFMGDVSKNIDYKLIDEEIDVIKIAHHGSNTSTSLQLIEKTRPKIAIIQTTRIEKFDFPSKEVINILKMNGVKIYQTKYDYQIKYVFNENNGYFRKLSKKLSIYFPKLKID